MSIVRVGIVILPDERWSVARERWRRAEEYGFHTAWTYDHIGWRSLVDGPWFDAVPTLTAAALVTSTIRLGTFVASPNFRHPVPFARELTDRFTEALVAAGRDPGSVERHLSLDASGVFALASVDAFTDAVGRATELGFTDVATHWPRRESWYAGDEAVLEAIAPLL